MSKKFADISIGQGFTEKDWDLSTPTYVKIEFVEVRNLDGDTWWVNAVNRTTGELVLFEDDEEIVI